jgi:hypothetical protein
MGKSGKLYLSASVLLIFAVGLAVMVNSSESLGREKSISQSPDLKGSSGNAKRVETVIGAGSQRRENALDRSQVEKADFYIDRLLDAETNLSGKDLDQKILSYLGDAEKHLRGKELMNLYEHLFERLDAKYLDWMISKTSSSLISGEFYQEGLEKVVNMTNNVLQSKVAMAVGKFVPAEDIKLVIGDLNTNSAKEKMLYAFGLQNVGADPMGTIRLFIENSPGDINYPLLSSITGQIRSDADFGAIVSLLAEDKQTNANPAIEGLLQSWTRLHPFEAGQYVLTSGSERSPAQVGAVVETWLKEDATSAVKWVTSIEYEQHRDAGYSTISQYQLEANPERSWGTAMKIKNATLREKVMKDVMKVWMKEDPDSARLEYVKIFPEKEGD